MRNRLLIAAAVVSGSVTAVPSAEAARIGEQDRLRGTFPAAMPGGYRAGERIPRRAALLRRQVALDRGENAVPVRFKCPGRRRVEAIATNDPGDVGFRVPSSQFPYTGRRAIRLELFASPNAARFPAHGRVYVLCRRK